MFRKFLVIPLLLMAVLFAAGCSGTKSAAAKGQSAVSAQAAGSSAPATPAECPSKNTKAFAKTRFVADVGLAFGAFHRYIYKPYKAGTFSKGASGRIRGLIKGAAAGGFSVWRLNAARNLLDDSPLLCKTLKAPMDALVAKIKGASSGVKSGDLTSIDSTNSALESFRSNAASQGMTITDQEPSSLSTS